MWLIISLLSLVLILMKLIEKQRQLVPYKTTWDLLAAGMYFQAWIRLSTQAKRAMRRRGYVYVRKEQ